MRIRTMQGLQVLRRAQEFLADLEVSPGLGSIKKHVDALGQIADRLDAHAIEQDVASRTFRGTANAAKEQLRALRVGFMRPVARMAQALFPDDPSLRQALRMPKVKDYGRLIAGALAMADLAAEHKDRFVLAGFDEDFAERLRKAATTLRTTLEEKNLHAGKRTAATAGLAGEHSRGRELVRLLDDMVSPWLRATPDRLAQWKAVSRFARVARPTEEEGTAQPGGTPNAPPPAAGTPPNASLTIGGEEGLPRAA